MFCTGLWFNENGLRLVAARLWRTWRRGSMVVNGVKWDKKGEMSWLTAELQLQWGTLAITQCQCHRSLSWEYTVCWLYASSVLVYVYTGAHSLKISFLLMLSFQVRCKKNPLLWDASTSKHLYTEILRICHLTPPRMFISCKSPASQWDLSATYVWYAS